MRPPGRSVSSDKNSDSPNNGIPSQEGIAPRSDGNKLALIGLLLIGLSLIAFGVAGNGVLLDDFPIGFGEDDLEPNDDGVTDASGEDATDFEEDADATGFGDTDDNDEHVSDEDTSNQTDTDATNDNSAEEAYVYLEDINFTLTDNATHLDWDFDSQNEDTDEYEVHIDWEADHPWEEMSDSGSAVASVTNGSYSEEFEGDACSIGWAELSLIHSPSGEVIESYRVGHDLECPEPSITLEDIAVWIEDNRLYVTWEYDAQNVDLDDFEVEIDWEVQREDGVFNQAGRERVPVEDGEFSTFVFGDECFEANVSVDLYEESYIEESHNLVYEPDCPDDEEDQESQANE